MTNRDSLLYRVMAANPLPNEQPLPDGLDDRRPPLAILTSEKTVVDASHRPPILPMTEIGAELLPTERSQRMDTQQRPKAQDTAPRTGWRTAAIAFAAIILVVGAVAGIAALIRNGEDDAVAGGAEEPTLTFDGTTVTYIGPTTLEAGTNTFSLENTHGTPVDFGKVLSTDENLTMEDVRVWSDPNATGQPAWFGGWEVIGFGMPGEVTDYDIVLPAGTYGLLVLDNFTGIFHPATVIQVTAD